MAEKIYSIEDISKMNGKQLMSLGKDWELKTYKADHKYSKEELDALLLESLAEINADIDMLSEEDYEAYGKDLRENIAKVFFSKPDKLIKRRKIHSKNTPEMFDHISKLYNMLEHSDQWNTEIAHGLEGIINELYNPNEDIRDETMENTEVLHSGAVEKEKSDEKEEIMADRIYTDKDFEGKNLDELMQIYLDVVNSPLQTSEQMFQYQRNMDYVTTYLSKHWSELARDWVETYKDISVMDEDTYRKTARGFTDYILTDMNKEEVEKQPETQEMDQKLREMSKIFNAKTIADRVYTKEDLQKYIDAMEDAAKATDNVNDFMNIQAFAEEDLLAFVNGDIDITPDAFDTMEKFIETFTGGYSDERIKKLYDQAMAKLNRRIEEEKAKLATVKSGNDGNDGGNTQSAGEPTGPDHSNGASKNDDNDEKHKTAQSLEEVVYGRLRSPYSDMSDFYLDTYKIEVLHDMGKISDKEFQDAQNAQTAEAVIELLNKVEPTIKEEEKPELENRLTDKILAYPDDFAAIPPKRLGLMYENVGERYRAAQDPTEQQRLGQAYQKLADRIDELTDMLAKKQHTSQDLFFADHTNIADCYDGYMQMFAARKPDLAALAKNPSTKADAQAKLDKMTLSTQVLDAHIKDYDNEWNLDNVNANSAPDLDERFDDIDAKMDKVEIDEHTLALVSNMKFLDANGNVEPQFVDKQGNKSDVYTQGAKIIKGSKLEEALILAKQQILMENLGTTTDITPAELSRAVTVALPETLYAIHVADKTANGALEDPNQFTDPNKLNAFMSELANTSKPMSITHNGFEAAKNALVNQTGAYASRLAQKVGNNKAVVSKLFKPVQKLDQRAEGRTEKMNPGKARKILFGRLAVGGASAFGISFALTTLGTAFGTDATLTAATGGLNKFAGALAGTALGTVATISAVRKWRKAQKASGQKAGFKEFVHNPQLLATVATTALGAAAVGFATTGNPGVASALGIGAMTIGTTNGVISNVARAKEMGLSTTEAAIWGVAQAAVNVGAGFGGRAVGTSFIDYINNKTDLNWFKHEEVIEKGWIEKGEEKIVYNEDAIPGAQKVLNEFYRGNPDALQADLDAVKTQLQAMGRTDISPERFLMEAVDAKMNTGVDTLLHVQGGEDIHSHGNHFVFTDKWAAEHGIATDDVRALGGIRGADGAIHLTPESIKAFETIDKHIGVHNTIGHTTGAGFQNDGVLGKNAAMVDGRQTVVDSGADRFATYADGDGAFTKIQGPDIVHPDVIGMVENPKHPMIGMLGTYMPKFFGSLKPREGSLMDKIVKKVIKPKKVKEPYIPPMSTVKVIKKPKPPYVPPTVKVVVPPEKELMLDEYKIVYGHEPDQKCYDAYYARVEKERVKEAPDLSMNEYLMLRRKQLDEFVSTHLSSLKEAQLGNAFLPVKCKANYMESTIKDTRSGAVIIGKARESLMQSNLTHENFTDAITLTHFKKYLGHYIAQDVMVADGTRDFTQNPTLKTNGDRIEIYDLNAYLVEGKSKGESNIQGKDGASIPLADIKLLRQRTKEEIEQGIYPKLDLEAIKNREKRLGILAKEQAERRIAKEQGGRE